MDKWKLFLRGLIWYVRFYVNGQEYKRSTDTDDIKIANYRAPKIISDFLEELKGEKEITLGQWGARYLRDSKLRKETWKDDLYMLKYFFEFFKKETILHSITPSRVADFIAWLCNRPLGKFTGRTIAKGRVNQYIRFGKALFNRAILEDEFKKKNPFARVKLFKVQSRERFFTVKELTDMWDASLEIAKRNKSQIQRMFPYIYLTAILMGCRLQEILQLKISDYKDGFFIIRNTKNKKRRYVPVRSELKNTLEQLTRSDDFIFDLPRRDSDVIARVWQLVKEEAGIEASARFHDLRHSHMSLLAEQGVDDRTIQEIGGWSDLAMVERYTHIRNHSKVRAIEKISLPFVTPVETSDEDKQKSTEQWACKNVKKNTKSKNPKSPKATVEAA